ncbi:MAG: phosphoribosylaminoimidazolesuccinocarboxamide synthase [Bacteroidales bacterium]
MEKKELIYDGKAKQLYSTDHPNFIVMMYKDDATAYYGVKKSSIKNKGVLNNRISELIFKKLEDVGIKTHFIKRLDDRNQLCKKVKILPLEFIVRNIIAGSLARRLDIPEGTVPNNTIYEICLKNDYLRDPLINEHHAVALGYTTYEELNKIWDITRKVNSELIRLFDKVDISVIDFKIEFGHDEEGNLLLVDEISPDTARFWDKESKQRLDKDRFRRDLGKVEEAYHEVLERLEKE